MRCSLRSPPGFGNPMNRFKKYRPCDAALHAFSSSTIKNIHATRDVTDLGKSCERDYFENKASTGNEISSFISFIFYIHFSLTLPSYLGMDQFVLYETE